MQRRAISDRSPRTRCRASRGSPKHRPAYARGSRNPSPANGRTTAPGSCTCRAGWCRPPPGRRRTRPWAPRPRHRPRPRARDGPRCRAWCLPIVAVSRGPPLHGRRRPVKVVIVAAPLLFGVLAKLILVFSLYAAPHANARRLGIEEPTYAMRKVVTLVGRVEGVLQQLFYSPRLWNLAKIFLDQLDHEFCPFLRRPQIFWLLSVVSVVGDNALQCAHL